VRVVEKVLVSLRVSGDGRNDATVRGGEVGAVGGGENGLGGGVELRELRGVRRPERAVRVIRVSTGQRAERERRTECRCDRGSRNRRPPSSEE
jgi:hypothetical protein